MKFFDCVSEINTKVRIKIAIRGVYTCRLSSGILSRHVTISTKKSMMVGMTTETTEQIADSFPATVACLLIRGR